MPVLLRIDSSAGGAASRTRALTEVLSEAWLGRGKGFAVVSRDLHENPPPHLGDTAQHWPERLRGGAVLDAGTVALQEAVIAELLAADAVVIGAPMYNYAVPSTLKAWLDLIHVPGVTAPFDVPTQPLAGRPAVIVSARGGTDEDGAFEHVFGPLRLVLGAGLGMDVRTIATRRTLAETIPDLGEGLAADELARAIDEARGLWETLLGGDPTCGERTRVGSEEIEQRLT